MYVRSRSRAASFESAGRSLSSKSSTGGPVAAFGDTVAVILFRGGSAELTDDDAPELTGTLAFASLGSTAFGTKSFTNAVVH